MATEKNTPTTFIYHPIGDDDPSTYGPDDLVHVEVDDDGTSHVWPYRSEMCNRSYLKGDHLKGSSRLARSKRPTER